MKNEDDQFYDSIKDDVGRALEVIRKAHKANRYDTVAKALLLIYEAIGEVVIKCEIAEIEFVAGAGKVSTN